MLRPSGPLTACVDEVSASNADVSTATPVNTVGEALPPDTAAAGVDDGLGQSSSAGLLATFFSNEMERARRPGAVAIGVDDDLEPSSNVGLLVASSSNVAAQDKKEGVGRWVKGQGCSLLLLSV